MTRASEVSRDVRDERIRDCLDLVELEASALVARNVRGGHDEWNDYRADMESAGRLALVEGAATFIGGGFRPWIRVVIRNAMLDEVRQLAGLRHAQNEDGGRSWRERDIVSLDGDRPKLKRKRHGHGNIEKETPDWNLRFHEHLVSRDSETAILNRIDRGRALDPDWRERERRIAGDPVAAWKRRRALAPLHSVVFRARRVEGRSLTDTARRAGINPFRVPRIEREAIERI